MFNSHQLHRFAIRKYAIGVCSVMVASLLFLGTIQVSADQLEAAAKPSTEQVAASPDQLQNQELEAEASGHQPAEANQALANEPVATPTTETVIAPTTEPSSSQPLDQVKEPQETKPETVQPASVPATQSVSVAEASKPAEQAVEEVAPVVQEQPASTSKEEKGQVDPATSDKEVSEPQVIPVESKPEPSPRTTDLAPAKFTRGTAFRSFGMTRSATPSGVIGDDYPDRWRHLDPDSNIDDWGMYVRYCTSFVAHRLSSANKFELPRAYGHAGEWDNRAKNEGYRVDSTPARGSVAFSDPTLSNKYGHVAWVAAVNNDMVTVEEYNPNWDFKYGTRTVHKSAFTGYIHFKDLSHGTVVTAPISSVGTTHGFPNQGSYTFTKRTGIKQSPSLSSPDRGTYEVGETVNYDKVLESENHVWLSYINFSGIRSYVAVKALTSVATPAQSRPTTGTIAIQNKNSQTGDFDVVITNVYHSAGVREVQVPVWSDKGGQDDIVWYKAQYQGGSTYKVSVKVSQHKNDIGTYHVHLYYVQDNGKQHGAGATTTQVSRQPVFPVTTPAPSLPSQGTYRFTKTLPIKSQAKMSSVTIDYYYAGETVNYDRVLTAEGRQWLSYLSHGGARRYIPLN